jgi:hypothetical protein
VAARLVASIALEISGTRRTETGFFPTVGNARVQGRDAFWTTDPRQKEKIIDALRLY